MNNQKKSKKSSNSNSCIPIGGQAVIEGVLMYTPRKISVSVRESTGKITTKVEKNNEDELVVLKIPFLRGIVKLFKTLLVGLRELNWSASKALGKEESVGGFGFFLAIILSILFALAFFKLLPLAIAQFFSSSFDFVKNNYIIFNVIDGLLKILIFILYILLISTLKDAKILFQYHGAEHKVVHMYEHKEKLTVKNAKKYKTIHSRCGTSFILLVLVLSILVYILIPSGFSFWLKLGCRILLLPIIAGVSYEILKLGARYDKNLFFRIIAWPGMFLQKITTKEPTNRQIEVAIASLKKVV